MSTEHYSKKYPVEFVYRHAPFHLMRNVGNCKSGPNVVNKPAESGPDTQPKPLEAQRQRPQLAKLPRFFVDKPNAVFKNVTNKPDYINNACELNDM